MVIIITCILFFCHVNQAEANKLSYLSSSEETLDNGRTYYFSMYLTIDTLIGFYKVELIALEEEIEYCFYLSNGKCKIKDNKALLFDINNGIISEVEINNEGAKFIKGISYLKDKNFIRINKNPKKIDYSLQIYYFDTIPLLPNKQTLVRYKDNIKIGRYRYLYGEFFDRYQIVDIKENTFDYYCIYDNKLFKFFSGVWEYKEGVVTLISEDGLSKLNFDVVDEETILPQICLPMTYSNEAFKLMKNK